MTFKELGLSEKVLQAVEAAGYATPTPIQAQAIPHVLARRDVLGIAQTGTGKTAAFTLPMLTVLESGRARARMPRTLILEPTRELAAQVEENFVKYGVNHKLSVALLIGGVSFGDQDAKITRGADVLIATPGRLLDHVERGKLLLTGVELLVIDEADRMLDMGFIPDIERVCKLVPFTRQTLFFTATMPPEIQRIADQFLHNPVRIEVSRPATAATTILQRLIACSSKDFDKRDRLRDLIRTTPDFKNAIIFCNRKTEVATLHRSLVRHGFSAVALHGDLDQQTRTKALDAFRNGEAQLLCASDVAARGLDIPDVSHVLNYDIPHHADDYVHRIGRTGRAGKTGTAFTLVGPGDEKSLSAIEKLTGKPIEWEGPKTAPASEAREDLRGDREQPRDSRGDRNRRGGRSRTPASGDVRAAEPARSRQSSALARPDVTKPDVAKAAVAKPAVAKPDVADVAVADAAREVRPSRQRPAPSEHAAAPRDRQSSREPVVLGLGDHVPSFLLRPVRVAT